MLNNGVKQAVVVFRRDRKFESQGILYDQRRLKVSPSHISRTDGAFDLKDNFVYLLSRNTNSSKSQPVVQ
jgi:hypothetical protein